MSPPQIPWQPPCLAAPRVGPGLLEMRRLRLPLAPWLSQCVGVGGDGVPCSETLREPPFHRARPTRPPLCAPLMSYVASAPHPTEQSPSHRARSQEQAEEPRIAGFWARGLHPHTDSFLSRLSGFSCLNGSRSCPQSGGPSTHDSPSVAHSPQPPPTALSLSRTSPRLSFRPRSSLCSRRTWALPRAHHVLAQAFHIPPSCLPAFAFPMRGVCKSHPHVHV